MCGIVGIYSNKQPVEGALLETMRDTMRHRGPDDAGSWISPDRRVGLAHRRLSIIDLSPGGHQPMSDAGGACTIVYNGEIYNYKELRRELEQKGHAFRSQSDTEVILEAYRAFGEECLSRLNGMFSFCLYDRERGRLFLARDRAGEKPLYYFCSPGGFRFASELKALMADPAFERSMDPQGLNHFLMYGYLPGAHCILKGVTKLPPGHCASYHLERGELSLRQYWTPPESAPACTLDSQELVQDLAGLLEDAVRRQLVADVPVGVLLSGGLDSSLMTALACRASSERVKTFTISFPEHRGIDESEHARLVASHFGTEHIELPAEPATVDLLADLARQYDEPLADSSLLPTYLVSRLVRQHATVAIGGDGGDELFGGYSHYNWILRQERLRALIPSALRSLVGCTGRHLPMGVRGRNYLIGVAGDVMNSVAHVNVFFDQHVRRQLLAPAPAVLQSDRPAADRFRSEHRVPGRSALHRAMAMDFATYLPEDILVKLDRASMLASLEVRAPFLDYRVIEFAYSRVPDLLRVAGSDRKILLRLLGEKLLPPALDIKRKQGFTIPIAQWLKGAWGAHFEEVLRGLPAELFDRRFVERLIESQHKGYANSQRIFALFMLELWRREYRVALP